MDQLQTKLRRIETQSDQLVESLRTGGRRAVQGKLIVTAIVSIHSLVDHLRGLEELIDHYDQEAREYHQRRDTKKAEIYLTKKKLVMKEVIEFPIRLAHPLSLSLSFADRYADWPATADRLITILSTSLLLLLLPKHEDKHAIACERFQIKTE